MLFDIENTLNGSQLIKTINNVTYLFKRIQYIKNEILVYIRPQKYYCYCQVTRDA